jgi:hypothetical protein
VKGDRQEQDASRRSPELRACCCAQRSYCALGWAKAEHRHTFPSMAAAVHTATPAHAQAAGPILGEHEQGPREKGAWCLKAALRSFEGRTRWAAPGLATSCLHMWRPSSNQFALGRCTSNCAHSGKSARTQLCCISRSPAKPPRPLGRHRLQRGASKMRRHRQPLRRHRMCTHIFQGSQMTRIPHRHNAYRLLSNHTSTLGGLQCRAERGTPKRCRCPSSE